MHQLIQTLILKFKDMYMIWNFTGKKECIE